MTHAQDTDEPSVFTPPKPYAHPSGGIAIDLADVDESTWVEFFAAPADLPRGQAVAERAWQGGRVLGHISACGRFAVTLIVEATGP